MSPGVPQGHYLANTHTEDSSGHLETRGGWCREAFLGVHIPHQNFSGNLTPTPSFNPIYHVGFLTRVMVPLDYRVGFESVFFLAQEHRIPPKINLR